MDLDLVLSQEYHRDVHFTLGTQVRKGPFSTFQKMGQVDTVIECNRTIET